MEKASFAILDNIVYLQLLLIKTKSYWGTYKLEREITSAAYMPHQQEVNPV